MKTKPITIQISSQQIPNYLDKKVIDEFAHLKIKSDDGQQHILINHLLWTSWSIFPKELLKDMFNEGPEDIIILSDFCIDSLKIFRDFIVSGYLPFSEVDILEDKLPMEINSMFLTFGIDIKLIFCSSHNMIRIKIEQKEDDNDTSQTLNEDNTLFINKRFSLNKIFQQNASKFAIFHV